VIIIQPTVIDKPNLNLYALQTYVDGSLNTINSTLATKENALTFTTPLKRATNTKSIEFIVTMTLNIL
jgi:hypothetical protein